MRGIPSLPVAVCLLLVHVCVTQAQLYKCRTPAQCDQVRCDQNLDVAIVGAGPSGTYSAYRLRDKGQRIGVFEYSDRVGGRLFTHKLEGSQHPLELGGMRLIDGAHARLQSIVNELGLTQTIFREGFGRAGRTRFFLRNQSLSVADIKTGEVPYNLTPEEKAHQDNLVEYYLEQLTGLRLDGQPLTRKASMRLRVKDGRLLYQLTFDEAFDLVASPEGKDFVRDTHVFETEVTGDVSAIQVFDDHLGEDGFGGDVHTVAEGMSAIPNKLLENFLNASEEHSVSMNRQLMAIRRRTDGEYVLYFEKTMTKDRLTIRTFLDNSVKVCTRQVILGIPHLALSVLDWPALKEQRVVNAMYGVRRIPASKVFMTFDKAWWLAGNRGSYVTKTDELFSQMYDWWSTNNSAPYTLMASYSDLEKSRLQRSLWALGPLMEGSETGTGRVSVPLKDYILDDIAKAYGIPRESIPEPKTATSQFWHSYPFGCGWITWRVGFHFDDTMDTMRRPSLKDEVYVVGSDFSWGLMSSWVEGALETADIMLETYFL